MLVYLNSCLLELLCQLFHLLVLDGDNRLLLSLLGLLDQLLGTLLGLDLLLLLFFLFLLTVELLEVAQAVDAPVVLGHDVTAVLLLALLEELLESKDRLVVLGELVAVELDSLQGRQTILGGGGEALDTGGGNLVVLQPQGLELGVGALGQGTGKQNTTLGTQERVTDAELLQEGPVRDNLGQGPGSGHGKGVVLKVKNPELGGVVETLAQKMRDTLLSDTVLHHLDLLNLVVKAVGLSPGRHTTILESVSAADDGLEVRDLLSLLSGGLLLGMKLGQGIGN